MRRFVAKHPAFALERTEHGLHIYDIKSRELEQAYPRGWWSWYFRHSE
jgi:hypothetical protein